MCNRLLLFLETIESSKSITEAAQKLFLSQPYISRVLKKYESKYNVSLVDRKTNPVRLTPAGHVFIKYMRKNLQLEENLRSELSQYTQNQFLTLKMGVSPPLGENFNLAVLPKLHMKFPNLVTKTVELTTPEAEKAFKDNQLDLFLGNPVYLENIERYSLHKDPQVLVLGSNSKLYHRGKSEIHLRKNDFQKLNNESFIVVDGESHYQEIVNSYFNEIGVNFYPKIHVRDSLTALELANMGLGNMTTCIEPMSNKKYDNINYVKLPTDKLEIDFSISTIRSKTKLFDEIEYVINILRKVFLKQILIF